MATCCTLHLLVMTFLYFLLITLKAKTFSPGPQTPIQAAPILLNDLILCCHSYSFMHYLQAQRRKILCRWYGLKLLIMFISLPFNLWVFFIHECQKVWQNEFSNHKSLPNSHSLLSLLNQPPSCSFCYTVKTLYQPRLEMFTYDNKMNSNLNVIQIFNLF